MTAICRYEEEEKERQAKMEQLQREENERKRREKLLEEQSLRDKLVKNVQQLEQRKVEIQRELLLRTLPSSGGGQLKSAVVIPENNTQRD